MQTHTKVKAHIKVSKKNQDSNFTWFENFPTSTERTCTQSTKKELITKTPEKLSYCYSFCVYLANLSLLSLVFLLFSHFILPPYKTLTLHGYLYGKLGQN
ncbi:hypothetical protein ACOSQ4_031409 [Xanthoceras sorbifolium]